MTPKLCVHALWAALTLLAACATPRAFGSRFPDNRRDDIARVMAQAKARQSDELPAVLVGVTRAPHQVFAYDLSGETMLWKLPAEPLSAPLIAGRYVVVPEQERVRLITVDRGQVALTIENEGLGLMGADGDAHVSAFVLSTGGTMGAHGRLVIVRDGVTTLDLAVSHPMGGPAVLGGMVFLPWNRIYVSALDDTGQELFRVRVKDDVASQAFVAGGEVYFGEAGMFRLDEQAAAGTAAEAAYFRSTRKERLPGSPAFLRSSSVAQPPVDSAVHRISLSFAPEPKDGSIALADDALYLTFYRQIFALDPASEAVHWVHQTQEDVVGVRAVPGGLMALDEGGTLSFLSAEGTVLGTASLGMQPVVGQFRADRLARSGVGTAPSSLTVQLVEAALNADNRLVPARVMAVKMLAGLDDSDATAALVEICQDRGVPERVRKISCVELSRRTTGSEAVIEALARHADFLEGLSAPPVGPLAEAAARSQDARAVPYLIEHLEDPNTAVEELPSLMLALRTLGDASVVQPVSDFLRMYHADADDPRMQDALVFAVQVLAKLQKQEALPVLEPIANDSLGSAKVRAEAARTLASLSPSQDAEGADAARPKEGSEAPAKPVEPARESPPEHLTLTHVKRALAPVLDKLSQCVRDDAKHPSSARLTIVVDGRSGAVLAVQTLPSSLEGCVRPLVLSVRFPATLTGRRETVTYQISR